MNYRTKRLFFSAILFSVSLFGASIFGISLAHGDIHDISRIFKQTPTLDAFEVCQGGGCAEFKQLAISHAEWSLVAKIFVDAPSNAEDERTKISQAIGEIERIVGDKNGTAADLAGTFYDDNITGQQDCNDEAINTTTYMRLLKAHDLMLHHEIEDTRTRNFFFTGWPHSTAVIRDIETDERFAVDSWFYDNGHAAVVIPFKTWKDNYRPDDSPIYQPKITRPKNVQTKSVLISAPSNSVQSQ